MTQPSLLPGFALLASITSLCLVSAEEPKESDYYKITPITAPSGEVIEGGGIELLPDGKVAICTRRGQVWMVENAFSYPDKAVKWTLFAEYLHEPLGLAWKDGWLYVVQRPEVTRLKDEDGDGRADVLETVSDGWGVNGNYRQGWEHLVRPLPDRLVYGGIALPGLDSPRFRRGQTAPNGEWSPFSGRSGIQRRR